MKKITEPFEWYDNISQEQIKEGVTEIWPIRTQSIEYYLPDHPAVRENSENPKECISYKGTARN